MFAKLLIANRGEIACRIIRTARRMGIGTVAVYSYADRNAQHVRLADEAVDIGPAPATESYLAVDRIVEACRRTGAEAVHPGYGFLSESMAFCERLEREGITLIGPPAAAVRTLGDKVAAKALARAAGVSVIPGSDEHPADPDAACELAATIGYPVMVKAAAGGGGRGIRFAATDDQLREAYVSCRKEALGSFGDDRLFIEKCIDRPRHIEFQVLADAHGAVVHLWERECSIQRRHQKLIEEAPSPFLDTRTRDEMGAQAVALARAAGYRSAGTVEFMVDAHRMFYFLEMNTRLQVEHPVTEMVTGLDLVELMIRVGAGEPLPIGQADVRCTGWALECRINAEDPFRGFLPSTGRLVDYLPPQEREGRVRVDSGVIEGDSVPPQYDSMIAKLVTHGQTRDETVALMRRALDRFVIRGVASNIPFQAAVLAHPRFLAGDFHTGFIAEEYAQGFDPGDVPRDDPPFLVALAAFVHRTRIDRQASVSGQLPGHELIVAECWTVVLDGEQYPVCARPLQGGYEIVCGDKTYVVESAWRFGQALFCGTCNGAAFCVQVEPVGLGYRLSHGGAQVEVRVMTARSAEMLLRMPQKPRRDLSGALRSPMPGLLTRIFVEEGQEVGRGERLVVIEAMKMENTLAAESDCVVGRVLVHEGESVAADQAIIEFC